jgi:hypothetical protein
MTTDDDMSADETDTQDTPSVSPRDALAVAQEALQKATAADHLTDEVDDLRDRVVALELRLSQDDDRTPYDQLATRDKVGMVRQHAFEKAVNNGGGAKLDYDDVTWEVFDGEPSAKHCYKLLRLAAEGGDGVDPVPGFEWVPRPANGNKHLRVDAGRAKSHGSFLPEKKRSEEAGG